MKFLPDERGVYDVICGCHVSGRQMGNKTDVCDSLHEGVGTAACKILKNCEATAK